MSVVNQGMPRVYRIGGGWGDHAEWLRMPTDDRSGRVTGHHTPAPVDGDEIESPMQSGKTGVFRLSNLKRYYDPPDQWFADATFVGYR